MSFLISVVLLFVLAVVCTLAVRWRRAALAAQRKIAMIEHVAATSCRGIFKRIDENRELLELVQQLAPEFLEKNFWVEGWLEAQDVFLNDMLDVMELKKKSFFNGAGTTAYGTGFPRAWPGSRQQARRGNAKGLSVVGTDPVFKEGD